MVKTQAMIAALALFSAGCTTMVETRGYVVDVVEPASLAVGDDTRTSVLAQLGSPSMTSLFDLQAGEESGELFDDDIWYYISYVRSARAYRNPSTASRTITAIRFDETDRVSEVAVLDVTAGKIIQYASRETPTRGRELGIIEQLFGNIGRLPTAGIGEERVPGQR